MRETALHGEADIVATQAMEAATVRAVFLLKFDANSMAVPCTDRSGAKQFLLDAGVGHAWPEGMAVCGGFSHHTPLKH